MNNYSKITALYSRLSVPILACVDPYKTAEAFAAAGWNIDLSQPPESGDPLVGVSLCGNSVLLGITEGYVSDDQLPHIGCGVEIFAMGRW